MMQWQDVFGKGLPYHQFLERHAAAEQRQRWAAVHQQVELLAGQAIVLHAFTRRMNVLCLAGAWCGDCVQQCPILQRIAEISLQIDLRFLDRDAHPSVQHELMINGGNRVPVVVFLSEDFFECARYGERTLSRYRDLAARQLGPSCPTGIVPLEQPVLAATTAEWVAEFERIQWMLRLSPRLRQKHGD